MCVQRSVKSLGGLRPHLLDLHMNPLKSPILYPSVSHRHKVNVLGSRFGLCPHLLHLSQL